MTDDQKWADMYAEALQEGIEAYPDAGKMAHAAGAALGLNPDDLQDDLNRRRAEWEAAAPEREKARELLERIFGEKATP